MNERTYKEKNGSLIKGTIFNVFVFEEEYYLTHIKVFADGSMDCLGPTNLTELERHLNSGKLVVYPLGGARIFVPYMGYAFINNPYENQNIKNFLRTIEEEILKLNSNYFLVDDCMEAFKRYLMDSSQDNFEELKRAHDALPEDKKAVFEVDYKDPLIGLMKGSKTFTKEERAHMLKDYFQGEWLEIK